MTTSRTERELGFDFGTLDHAQCLAALRLYADASIQAFSAASEYGFYINSTTANLGKNLADAASIDDAKKHTALMLTRHAEIGGQFVTRVERIALDTGHGLRLIVEQQPAGTAKQ
jgi:hypothetical protein